MYMLIVRYESDAERKRLDYAIERWENKIKVEKPKGAVILVEGNEEDVKDFIEDVFSRVDNPKEKVSVYRLKSYKPEVEKKSRTLKYEVKDVKSVKKFVDYLMAKVGACLSYSNGQCNVYNVQTKKGLVRLEVCFRDHKLFFRFEGYGKGVDHLVTRIDEEMKMFLS